MQNPLEQWRTRRLFIAGKPDKSSIYEGIQKMFPRFWDFDIDRDGLLNPVNWEVAEENGVQGYKVPVVYRPKEEIVQTILAQDSLLARDSGGC
jgi:hypothetical protein